MAAASKRFGHARGKKVVKEIRGGLPEKDANRGFWGVSTFFLIVKSWLPESVRMPKVKF